MSLRELFKLTSRYSTLRISLEAGFSGNARICLSQDIYKIIYRQQMEVLNVLESIEAVLAFGWDVVFLVGTVDQEYGCEDVDAQVWRWRTLHKHFEKFDKLWLTNFRRLTSPSSFGFQIFNTYRETSFSDVGSGNFLDNQLRR